MTPETSAEDRLVAALCHASLLIPVLGMMVPLVVWLTQKDRSTVLRFQPLQALLYQGVGMVGLLFLYACQMAGSLGSFVPIMGVAALAPQNLSGNGGDSFLAGLLIAIVMLGSILMVILGTLQCIAAPVYAVIGLVGSWQILKEKDFRYPILGRWLERRYPSEKPDGAEAGG